MDGRLLAVGALIIAGLMMTNQGDAQPTGTDQAMLDEPPPEGDPQAGEGLGGFTQGAGLGALAQGYGGNRGRAFSMPAIRAGQRLRLRVWGYGRGANYYLPGSGRARAQSLARMLNAYGFRSVSAQDYGTWVSAVMTAGRSVSFDGAYYQALMAANAAGYPVGQSGHDFVSY